MDDARRKEIQRALTLIREAKDILVVATTQEQENFENMPEDVQGDEEGQRAEDVVDALERAAMCCDDAISACEERYKNSTSIAVLRWQAALVQRQKSLNGRALSCE
jgi:hypothetical protein